MAEKKEFTIKAARREGRGKNDARRVRAAGRVPLTIYGGEGDSVSASASLAELAAILRTESGHNTIFTLDIDGEGGHDVMFLDRQIDPVRGRLVHADLRRLVRGQKIEVTVPLHLTGEPIGVTEGGGVLEQMVREIEIRVRPRDIPDAIDLDVSNLGVHDVLHVSDLQVAENIEILNEPDTVLATVGIIAEEPVETPVATDEDEAAEPEVIGKGKKDEGDEA
ncbi:MAG TPA: 50S ribosomal protein L25 [Pyrinomonadaceae bacterium]|nr:50S ribosomal protein L25 [Pyrinomonadaceae bacterium]